MQVCCLILMTELLLNPLFVITQLDMPENWLAHPVLGHYPPYSRRITNYLVIKLLFLDVRYLILVDAGQAFGLMEYYAPCFTNGSLAILFFGISRNGRNILASSNHSATFSVQSPPSYSAATKPRVALMGEVTPLPRDFEHSDEFRTCYLKSHPDASWWVPGNKAGVHDVSDGQTWSNQTANPLLLGCMGPI